MGEKKLPDSPPVPTPPEPQLITYRDSGSAGMGIGIGLIGTVIVLLIAVLSRG
jgi:hypothetical protein